jgi:hypothetical protein
MKAEIPWISAFFFLCVLCDLAVQNTALHSSQEPSGRSNERRRPGSRLE